MSNFEETVRVFMLERFEDDCEDVIADIEDSLVLDSEISIKLDTLTVEQKKHLNKILDTI